MRTPKPPPITFNRLLDELKTEDYSPGLAGDPVARELIGQANNEGWNWEDCSYRGHLAGFTPRQFWLHVKLSRWGDRHAIPLSDKQGRPFTYRLPPAAHRTLHLIDSHLGGTLGAEFPGIESDAERTRYLLTSLREEAIASSLIEGAVVTREVAKEMLRTERRPRTPGERMILNNYRTIQTLNARRREPLTIDLLAEVQRSLTDGTLSDPTAAGRFRTPAENIAVMDDETGEPLHVPPPAAELPDRARALCAFANADPATADKNEFIHPAVRAIVLHFWLAYDHPFVDGNGRTARALFYWSMLRAGYWLTEYLTVSTVINGQPKQYARAYLNTETDDNDLTYFLLYHLGVIERSLTAFREYLDRKTREQRDTVLLRAGPFNPRQRALLARAVRDPAALFTYESHARSHRVTIATARTDLLALEERGLLVGLRAGRRFEFRPAADIAARLRKLGGRA